MEHEDEQRLNAPEEGDVEIAPEEWAEVEKCLAEFEASGRATVPWNDVASRIRRRFGWPASNSGPERTGS